LRRSFLRCLHQAVLEDTRLEHPGNQANDPRIADPVAEKFQHPFVRHGAEEVPDVGLDDMVDALLLDHSPQRIQALMLAAFRSVAVAAVLELHLVDGFQHPFHRQLHQLVFVHS